MYDLEAMLGSSALALLLLLPLFLSADLQVDTDNFAFQPHQTTP